MRTRTQRIMAWSMMAVLLLGSAPLSARERKGAQVVVQRENGSEIRDELLTVKRDGLVVGNGSGGALVGLAEIGSVRIKKKSRAGTGMLIGFLGGTLVAFGISRDSHSCNDAVMDAGLSGIFIGLPAAGLGALIGMGLGKDSILNKDEMNPEDLLEKLNRHARTPDAALSTGHK